MIHLTNVSLSFGAQTVFNNLSLSIKLNQHIGLVGRNGSGKSTLFKVITGHQKIDAGSIALSKNTCIAYLPQEVVLDSSETIFDEALNTFPTIAKLSKEVRLLEKKLSNNPSSETVVRYSELLSTLGELEASKKESEIKKVLTGLGFSEEVQAKPVTSLSTGWKMRLVLAKLLLQKADFYLFDEPTNHLDIFARDWFLSFLSEASFGFILISHERHFLNQVCSSIIDLKGKQATLYNGSYSSFEKQKEARDALKLAAYKNQQQEITRKQKVIDRFRAKSTKAKMVQSMIKSLEKKELVELDVQAKTMRFSFSTPPQSGRVVLEVNSVAHSFGKKSIFKNASFDVERGEKVALVAANGVGKTTLFNVITGTYSLQEGSISFGYNVKHALFTQDHKSMLDDNETIIDEIERLAPHQTTQYIRTMLGSFLFSNDDVLKKIRVLSGGEKNRVRMVATLLQNANFLLLDEPTNHLDLQSKDILVEALKSYKGSILFVSHDHSFINALATRTLELSFAGIQSYPGNYDSYLEQKKSHSPVSNEILETKPNKKNTPRPNETRKQQKKLESLLDSLQKKIESREEKLRTLTYGTEEFDTTYASLQKHEQEYHDLFSEWETLENKNA